ncbi:MAG: glycosyltransferase family 2 protein [Solirubrobacterales bacterium]
MATVAVAVVSWNTREQLRECLDSLAIEHEGGRAEVWVVDNASSDGSADLVRESYPWAELVAVDENLGFGAAVNLVSERTRSEWIAPANADVRLEPGALERLLAAGRADPAAGIVAPRLVLPDGTVQHSIFSFPTVPFTILHGLGAFRLSRRLRRRWPVPGGWDGARSGPVPWAVGAFLLVRRSAWDAIGGFDPSQWMFAEDLDLGWRARRGGWHTIYAADAVFHHDESSATTKLWEEGQRYDRWHRSTYAWMLRRRGLAITRTVALINVIAYAVRAALLTPLALARGGRWRTARHAALGAVRAHCTGLAPRATLERHH